MQKATWEVSFTSRFWRYDLFPLFFGVLLRLIYVLNSIPNGNIEPVFPPIISFIKISVAEKVAKLLVEWCRVVVG
jgi:hypothetical protein